MYPQLAVDHERPGSQTYSNICCFAQAPDFDDTEAAWKIKTRMRQLGDMFERRDLDNILGVLPDFMYPTGGADGMEATKKAYAEALSSASEKFWKLSALQPSWNFDHLTTILSSQEEWHMDSPPVVLACSDQAPLVVVSESTQRLHHLLPGSRLEFIPSSKWSWQLEGEDIWDETVMLLKEVLPTGVEVHSGPVHIFACEERRQVHVIGPLSHRGSNLYRFVGCYTQDIYRERKLVPLGSWASKAGLLSIRPCPVPGASAIYSLSVATASPGALGQSAACEDLGDHGR